jgi:hypothetical protein
MVRFTFCNTKYAHAPARFFSVAHTALALFPVVFWQRLVRLC